MILQSVIGLSQSDNEWFLKPRIINNDTIGERLTYVSTRVEINGLDIDTLFAIFRYDDRFHDMSLRIAVDSPLGYPCRFLRNQDGEFTTSGNVILIVDNGPTDFSEKEIYPAFFKLNYIELEEGIAARILSNEQTRIHIITTTGFWLLFSHEDIKIEDIIISITINRCELPY